MIKLTFDYPNDPYMSTAVVVNGVYTYYFPYVKHSDRKLFESGMTTLMFDWSKDLD